MDVNITPVNTFAELFDSLIVKLQTDLAASTGTVPVIVAANIPRVTDVPYFVPLAAFNDEWGTPVTTVETGVVSVRFPAFGYLADDGVLPLASTWTLTAAEVQTVDDAVNAYNARIEQICDARGIGLMDAHSLLAGLSSNAGDSYTTGHFALEQEISTIYSLDGIHPNNKGYALVANAWIEAINDHAGTLYEQVDVSGVVWDPTYGIANEAESLSGSRIISSEASEALDHLFR
jgi:lysophospholipase L1-like esterase